MAIAMAVAALCLSIPAIRALGRVCGENRMSAATRVATILASLCLVASVLRLYAADVPWALATLVLATYLGHLPVAALLFKRLRGRMRAAGVTNSRSAVTDEDRVGPSPQRVAMMEVFNDSWLVRPFARLSVRIVSLSTRHLMVTMLVLGACGLAEAALTSKAPTAVLVVGVVVLEIGAFRGSALFFRAIHLSPRPTQGAWLVLSVLACALPLLPAIRCSPFESASQFALFVAILVLATVVVGPLLVPPERIGRVRIAAVVVVFLMALDARFSWLVSHHRLVVAPAVAAGASLALGSTVSLSLSILRELFGWISTTGQRIRSLREAAVWSGTKLRYEPGGFEVADVVAALLRRYDSAQVGTTRALVSESVSWPSAWNRLTLEAEALYFSDAERLDDFARADHSPWFRPRLSRVMDLRGGRTMYPPHTTVEVFAYLDEGRALWEAGDFENSETSFQTASDILSAAGNAPELQHIQVNAVQCLLRALLRRGAVEEAGRLFEKALKFVTRLDLRVRILLLGARFERALGRDMLAFKWLEEAYAAKLAGHAPRVRMTGRLADYVEESRALSDRKLADYVSKLPPGSERDLFLDVAAGRAEAEGRELVQILADLAEYAHRFDRDAAPHWYDRLSALASCGVDEARRLSRLYHVRVVASLFERPRTGVDGGYLVAQLDPKSLAAHDEARLSAKAKRSLSTERGWLGDLSTAAILESLGPRASAERDVLLSRAELDFGRVGRAEAAALRAVAMAAEAKSGEWTILAYEALAHARFKLGDDARGVQALIQGVDAEESIRGRIRSSDWKMALRERFAALHAAAIDGAARLGHADLVFDLSERARARTLLDALGSASVSRSRDSDEARGYEQALKRLEATRTELDVLNLTESHPSHAARVVSLERAYAAFVTEVESAREAMIRADPQSAALHTNAPTTIELARDALAEDEALLTYFYTESSSSPAASRDRRPRSCASLTFRRLTALRLKRERNLPELRLVSTPRGEQRSFGRRFSAHSMRSSLRRSHDV
ncbi:MAG: hypothetical protein ACHREM_11180 [Polyangiales bacterium]